MRKKPPARVQLDAALSSLPKKKPKYNNKPKICSNGHEHGSITEADVCDAQRGLGRTVEAVQERILLSAGKVLYIADIRTRDPAAGVVWVEAKGRADQKWPIKAMLWAAYGLGPLEIWKRNDSGELYVAEVIFPGVGRLVPGAKKFRAR